MKEVRAIVQPFKVPAITDALQAIPGVGGITAIDVLGFGHQRGMSGLERPAQGSVNYTAKVLLLLVVHDDLVEQVLGAIRVQGHTGNFGGRKGVRVVGRRCAQAPYRRARRGGDLGSPAAGERARARPGAPSVGCGVGAVGGLASRW